MIAHAAGKMAEADALLKTTRTERPLRDVMRSSVKLNGRPVAADGREGCGFSWPQGAGD